MSSASIDTFKCLLIILNVSSLSKTCIQLVIDKVVCVLRTVHVVTDYFLSIYILINLPAVAAGALVPGDQGVLMGLTAVRSLAVCIFHISVTSACGQQGGSPWAGLDSESYIWGRWSSQDQSLQRAKTRLIPGSSIREGQQWPSSWAPDGFSLWWFNVQS